MGFLKGFLLGIFLLEGISCSPSKDNSASGSCSVLSTRYGKNLSEPTGNNVLNVKIGGKSGICGIYGYHNEPCASITICEPGTNNCQEVGDLLVDTASVGIRVFESALTVTLPSVLNNLGKEIAQCVTFGTASDWGPVKLADVQMAQLSKISSIPIQVIQKTYATPPNSCSQADTTPENAGYNGILGVGLHLYDCGSVCSRDSTNGMYYACTSGSCSASAAPLSKQVKNPVSALSSHNNGFYLQFPSVQSCEGDLEVNGFLVFGIGTSDNNAPTSYEVFQASSRGTFKTKYNNQTFSSSYIDSGSNGIFLPFSNGSSLNTYGGFYAPSSAVQASASAQSSDSSGASANIDFQIGNARSLLQSSQKVFSNLVGSYPAISNVDWGLPFFLGRKVFQCIDNQSCVIGTGPFWAF